MLSTPCDSLGNIIARGRCVSGNALTENVWEDAVQAVYPQIQPSLRALHYQLRAQGASGDGSVLRLRVHYRVSHNVFVNVEWRSPISFWKRTVVEWIGQT